MDKAAVDKLLKSASNDERIQLTTLYNAAVENLKRYQDDKSRSVLLDWQAAEDALARLVKDLEAKYFPVDPPFETRIDVLKYLQGKGYGLKKSKLYNDAKNGLLKIQPDGTVRRSDVSDYILRAELKKKTDEYGNVEELHAQKSQKEMEKLQVQIEKLQFELQKDRGKYLLKSDVRTEIAIKIAVFEAGLKHLARTRAADWIYAVGGDAKKTQVWINLFTAAVDELLNEFGRLDEINVEIQNADAVA